MADAKKPYYKYCIVPRCKSTTVKCKDKLFFSVPKENGIRKKWIKAMKRDEKLNSKLSNKSSLWCCEDHFSLKDDMENYLQWSLTKDVRRLKLKPGTVPHLFHCQSQNVEVPIERKGAKKRAQMFLVQEAFASAAAQNRSEPTQDAQEDLDIAIPRFCDKSTQTEENILKKPVKYFRSKGINTSVAIRSVATSPVKFNVPEFITDLSCLPAKDFLIPREENEHRGDSEFESPSKSSSGASQWSPTIMKTKKTPKYIEVDGYRYCQCFVPDIIKAAIDYKPAPNDIFVATYPKCGTTWMIQTVMLILNKGKVPDTIEEYFALSPFLEMLGPEEIKNMPGPGCIKIHFPFNLTPYSPDAKYVYVARNPKDCCISFFHHTKLFPAYYYNDGTFEEFFELFIEGKTDFNDYFDNLLSWYEHRNDSNVFFVTYEAMKKDPASTIQKLAAFLGKEYSDALADNEELLGEIVHKSSFEHMKKTTNKLFMEMLDRCEEYAENPKAPRGFRAWCKFNAEAIKEGQGSNGDFVRNGGVGNWKLELSEEQEERLNKRILEKTKGSDVMTLWNEES
ncbi:uncharacterized protein LOC129220992 [Uloborus diversus]|uniref:uncharacterized protein LOC129220992 n=1 Tax=Uloborus diversus TaxID=327109 RepID=UPI0024090A73|nr:uncharacterized protein LOC129220992 [Uloborus diversus]